MVPILPPEIWLKIGQFVPPNILKKLYAVNSVFFDLALNEKYSDLSFTFCWTPGIIKRFKHLKRPHIARRVKHLTLSSDWFQSNLYTTVAFLDEITSCMAIALWLPFGLGNFDHIARRVHNLRKFDKLMRMTVCKFPNISSLTIVDGPGASLQTGPSPLLVNAYTACASTLRVVSLVIKTTEFQAFPSNASELTSLEEVNLKFFPSLGRGAYPEATSKFLLAVASSIVTLNISFCDTFRSAEPSQLLRNLPQSKATFPNLRTFSLLHSGPNATPTSNLLQFLNQHAATLKHLRLQFTIPTFVFQSQDDLAVLSQLEIFEILIAPSLWSRTIGKASHEGLDTVRSFVQHSWSTLTSVSLMHCSFTHYELGILLDLLARRPPRNTEGGWLTSLGVTVSLLTPRVLDMLAGKLPQLEKLIIGFTYLRSNAANVECEGSGEDLTTEVIEPFLLEMEVRSYSKWSLRSFGVDHTRSDPTTMSMLLTKLALCMPRLVEINGPILLRKEGGTWLKMYDYNYSR